MSYFIAIVIKCFIVIKYFIAVPAVLNEAVPAAMRDVENELKHVLLDVSRYTGS